MFHPTHRKYGEILGVLIALFAFGCSESAPPDSTGSSSKQGAARLFEAATAQAPKSGEPITSKPIAPPTAPQTHRGTSERSPASVKTKEVGPADSRLVQSGAAGSPNDRSPDALRRWNVYRPEDLQRPREELPYISNVGFSPDGALAVAVTSAKKREDQAIIVAWNIASGKEVVRTTGTGWRGFNRSALSPDGRQIAVADYESEVILLDLRSGKETLRLKGEIGYPLAASFSPDGRFFLGAGFGKHKVILYAWNTTTGEQVQRFSRPSLLADTLRVLRDGRHVLLGNEEVWRWNFVTGEVAEKYRTSHPGTSESFSPDERHVLSKGGILWHLGSGRQLARIPSFVVFAELLPGNAQAVALDRDGICRLWDIRAGKELMQLQDSEERTSSLAISPDGQQALTASRDGTVRLWPIGDAAIKAYQPPIAPREDKPIAIRATYESMPPGRERNKAELEFHLESGRAMDRSSKFAEAVSHYEKAFALAERLHEPELVDQLPEVGKVARYYRDHGAMEKAEFWFQRQLQWYTKKYGRNSPAVVAALSSLALLYSQKMGRFDEAERLVLEQIEICKTFTEPQYKNQLPMALNSLYVLYKAAGNLPKAEQALKRSTEVWVEEFGEGDSHVANNLGELIRFYRNVLKDDLKAKPHYTRMLELQTAQWGPNHPLIESMVIEAVFFYAKLKDFDVVFSLLDRAVRIRFNYMAHKLASASEEEQQKTLENAKHNFNLALWFALEKQDDPAIASRSAEWVANLKGIATRTLGERARMALRSSNPEVSEHAKQLREVRDRLAALNFTAPKSNQVKENRREYNSLREQEAQISTQLTLEGWEELRLQSWVTLEQIRAALPRDSVLIDCIRVRSSSYYKPRLPEYNWTEDRYAAWIIPPAGKGEVQLLDLGPAERMDAAVIRFHQAVNITTLFIGKNGERRSEGMLREALRPVSRKLVNRLERYLGDVPHWIISPDSALALLPWGALPIRGRGYAIESHTISYLVSGRDVVPKKSSPEAGPPVIVADPDYDLGLPAAHQGPKPFTRLPGTAVEADRIAPLLSRYANESPAVFRRSEATEEAVKTILQPRAIVLSTHGYFAPLASQFQNPLLCCGLAFAGANKALVTGETTEEDGILTGMEVVGLDLRGTELVVLSACQTGLGFSRPGEGVVGLRQAFQLAGADALVATLWSIPDLETADLTSSFFSHLADGKGKAEALRAAKLEVIRARRQQHKAAHPVFWAAFTLTGSWD